MKKMNLKTYFASMAAIITMGVTVMAGTYTYSHDTAFTVDAGWKAWVSEQVGFEDKSSHTMKVGFQTTYAKGEAHIGICKKVLGTYYDIVYSDFAITTGTAGVQYTFSFSNVSRGNRYYIFGSDETANYRISYFNDTWS